jgi:hypothetical protein
MNSAHRHLTRYPHCRRSTLDYLEKRAETTERLKKEIAAARRERNRLFEIVKRTGLWPSWIWRR